MMLRAKPDSESSRGHGHFIPLTILRTVRLTSVSAKHAGS